VLRLPIYIEVRVPDNVEVSCKDGRKVMLDN
jgi:hypothetical protein